MATTLQKPLKMDGTDDPAFEYPEPINTANDGLAAAGFYPQTGAGFDQNAGIERDGSGNLILKDTLAGTKTLSSLLGAPLYDFLLDCPPDDVGITYVLTRTSGLVSKETWTNTSTSKTVKTIDYTRSSGLVTVMVTKIFASNGTTVVAQTTETLSRTSGVVTGSTKTRDV